MDDAAAAVAAVEEMQRQMQANFVDHDPSSELASFYANRCVFITGATGFVGKAIAEKLVRTCKDIKRIYLLIRDKRNKDVKERLAELYQSQCFRQIRSQPGGLRSLEEKLYAIKGDITLPNFGISQEDMELLSRDVTIVFNSAASVRFVEPLDVAVRNNIYSVSQLVVVVNQLQNLEAVIHVSTAYSNCNRKDTIQEIFYDPPVSGDKILQTVEYIRELQETLDSFEVTDGTRGAENEVGGDFVHHAQRFANRIVRKFYQPKSRDAMDIYTEEALIKAHRPNTYTFTKAIAESFLLELVKRKPERYLNGKIPVSVVRPSIVCGAWREPEVGFVDSYSGPTKANLDMGLGTLHAVSGTGAMRGDLVPIDMVANMIIAVGWFLVTSNSGRHQQAASLDDTTGAGPTTLQHRRTSSISEGQPTGRSSRINSVSSSYKQVQAGRGEIKSDKGGFVFNMVTGYRNPTRWDAVTDSVHSCAYKFPSKYLVRLPSGRFIPAGWIYKIYDFFMQTIPAHLLDLMQVYLEGKELTKRTSLVFNHQRNLQMLETLVPFLTHQWLLCDDNTRCLYERLSPVDKDLFPFDVTQIDWPKYLDNYNVGSRIYLLKDEPLDKRSVQIGVKKLKTRRRIYHGTLAVLFLIFYYFCLHQTPLERSLLSLVGV